MDFAPIRKILRSVQCAGNLCQLSTLQTLGIKTKTPNQFHRPVFVHTKTQHHTALLHLCRYSNLMDSKEIVYDVPMFFKVYKDGRVEKYRKHDFAPLSDNPITGVRSKDIVIVTENNVTVRLYLPKITPNDDQKFPLLVYFHGGGFVIESAFSTYYDSYLHSLAAETNVLVVSVEYRLAPYLVTELLAMAEIVHDLFPLMRVYKDGRIERLMGEGFVPPESDPETGLQVKDVEIDPQINLSARLYLPKNVDSVQKIPLFVYFHGGAFVIESASSPTYHKHLSMVAAEAKVVIVSVNYRLAPEYPLPIAYEDSWVALKWIASHANGDGDGHEPWMKDHADFNRVYFGGDSAGGNIAHHMAIRVGLEKLEGVKLVGIYLACPYFWGKELIDGEEEYLAAKDFIDRLWLFANPNRSGLDDPLINPEKDPNLCSLGCEKVLVYLAGKDPLRIRGFSYKEALEKSGWPGTVEVMEIKGEEHVFHLFAPQAENAIAMLKKLVSFLNQGDV